MNKQELKRLIEKTYVMIEGGTNNLIAPWIKIVESAGLEYKVGDGVGGKLLCVVTQSGALEVFDSHFISIKFPTLEQFLKDGDNVQDGDFIYNGLEQEVFAIEDRQEYWNKKDADDRKFRVIFAQCWLDEPHVCGKFFDSYKEAKSEYPFCDAVLTTGPEWNSDKAVIGKFIPVIKTVIGFKYKYKRADDLDIFLKIGNTNWVVAEEPKKPKRHPHADMIHTKADNMDLVLIQYQTVFEKWRQLPDDFFPDGNGFQKYFLSLPKHKEAVLNLLNGGESQIKFGDEWRDVQLSSEWYATQWYMHDHIESRIKPKQPTKVKRWIMILDDGTEVLVDEEPTVLSSNTRVREIEIEL